MIISPEICSFLTNFPDTQSSIYLLKKKIEFSYLIVIKIKLSVPDKYVLFYFYIL